MAQTISELKREREELLKQIEAEANQISSSRGAPQEHTLQDWLKAAEAVIPDDPKIRPADKPAEETLAAEDIPLEEDRFSFLSRKPPPTQEPQEKPTMKATETSTPKVAKASKASFFGVIIMLSLFLTILGVVYIAYISIHKELQSVLEIKDASQQEISDIKSAVSELQEMVKAGGEPEKFNQLAEKVAILEQEISGLKSQLAEQKKAEKTSPLVKLFDKNHGKEPELVTTAVLDKKLQTYTQSLDRKLQMILNKLSTEAAVAEAPKVVESPKEEVSIAEPQAPQVEEVKMMNQPVVRLVEKLPESRHTSMPAVQPVKEVVPEAPSMPVSADVKWLLTEPALNYTLQLASMDDRSGIEQIIRQKSLQNAKILPQMRNGETRYVLVVGSFTSRESASVAAKQVKDDYKITPWIRKVKDISRLAQ